jgi:hypothetical protein
MNILDSIFEKWNSAKDIEDLIASGFFTDKDAIQENLDKLSGDKKDSAILMLNDIQSALETYISDLEQNMSGVKDQIDTTHKSEKACLSYGSSINIQNKKEKD